MIDLASTKRFLDKKVDEYNNLQFIDSDPVQIPHMFSRKEDIEISAFLTATIAWGQRTSIIKSAQKLMELMDNSPADFIYNAGNKELEVFKTYVYRTFQPSDCIFFIRSLQNIYKKQQGLENIFLNAFNAKNSIYSALCGFRKIFLNMAHNARLEKHIANVQANSSAKRLNLFLRWMVRNDGRGVDFGLWKNIPASALMLPLDVHTGNVARQLSLLTRKQNDWLAVESLTALLREFDPADPVKYDYALFGIGAFEKGIQNY